MDNNKITELDLLIESHVDLFRQGPGSNEITAKALSFIEGLNEKSYIVDMGSGTGGQTLELAKHIKGKIIGVDMFEEFVDAFNRNMKNLGFEDRVKGIVGSMDKLDFSIDTFNLIWCEGAIDNIGFEKGLSYWNNFLKTNGYVAVTSPSWLDNNKPDEVKEFFNKFGSNLNTDEGNWI